MRVRVYIVIFILRFFAEGLKPISAVTVKNSKITQEDVRKLIIDTDAGSDDAVAILNLLGAEQLFHKLQILLITAVQGNTHVDNVGRNVLKILSVANRLDIPVYKGMNESLLTTPEISDYFGKDGLGDFKFPNPPKEDLIKVGHAAYALVNIASSFVGQLTLVCLGPLTNIAMAIKLDPNFFKNLKEIFVLGGSYRGLGNIRPGIEFNFHVDPESVSILFKEAQKIKKQIYLVPWETAYLKSSLEMNWRKNVLGNLQSPQIDFINKAENMHLNGSKWVSADAVLSAIVIDSNIVESENNFYVDVEVCGQISRGSIFVDFERTENKTKNIRIIRKINITQYKQMLMQNLNPIDDQTGFFSF